MQVRGQAAVASLPRPSCLRGRGAREEPQEDSLESFDRLEPMLPNLLSVGSSTTYQNVPFRSPRGAQAYPPTVSERFADQSPRSELMQNTVSRTRSYWRRFMTISTTSLQKAMQAEPSVVPKVAPVSDDRLSPDSVVECTRRLHACCDFRLMDLDFDVDQPFERLVVYKNHSLSTSCLLHFAVMSASRTSGDATLVRQVLERGANVHAKARYSNPNGTETEFEAIHMAAGLGCTAILDVLMEFAVPEKSGVLGRSPEALAATFVSTWATILPGGAQSYQPIHDAAFGRQKDALMWLLSHGCDASSPNLHGCTALHFLALNGVSEESPAVIEEVVRALLDHDPNMSTLDAKIWSSHHTESLRGKIPLECAAMSCSQFPKEVMYLLAPSHWDANTAPRFFEDLLLLTRSNTTHAADALARKICEKASQSTHAGSLMRTRVRQEAQKWAYPTSGSDQECKKCGMSTLAALFYMVPRAAADMVDILTAKPLVQDPAKHPIPSRASLAAPQLLPFGGSTSQPMLCSYQTDVTKYGDLVRPEWKFDAEKIERDQPEIKWHRQLVHEPKDTHLGRRDNIYPVSTKVVLWPNLLDLDVCRALACTQAKDDNIFARLPVQAIVFWFWNSLGYPALVITWLFRCIELIALVQWGIGGEGHVTATHPVCWAILAAGNMREVSNMLWCFKEYCVRWWEHRRADSVLRCLWEPTGFVAENTVDVLSVGLRTWLLADRGRLFDEVTNITQALIAVNVMFGFFRLIYMLRMLDGMGKGILAILETFFSGTIQQMLFICAMVFANFYLAFIMLARHQDPSEVFLQLYRGFLFGDGEALDYLGLDVADGGYATIPIGPYFSINMNRMLSLVGTLFFTVIILNLIIAIYGNEYEKIKRVTGLLFLKQRLRMSCDCVLSHCKLVGPTPLWLSVCILPLTFLAAADLLLHQAWLPWPHYLSQAQCVMVATLLLAIGQSILQMVLLQGLGQRDGVHMHDHCIKGEPRFLWICHRSDFSTHAFDSQDVTKEDFNHLAEEVNRKLHRLDRSIEKTVARLDAKMDRVLSLVERSMVYR